MSAPISSAQVSDMQEDSAVLDMPDPEEQDDLISENEPDFMENEQTWPTEEELAEADGKSVYRCHVHIYFVRVPTETNCLNLLFPCRQREYDK
jgi:hypothetical protein